MGFLGGGGGAAGARRAGIVQGLAEVDAMEPRGDAGASDFRALRVRFPAGAAAGAQQGASVAINGTCLTVVDIAGDVLGFDVMGETLARTNLGRLGPGSAVNFERAARVGDEVGGHTVSGHVHAVGEIRAKERDGENVCVTVGAPPELMKYILPKGFIAVDGASLTVGETGPDWFNVWLIPETLRMTVLGAHCGGEPVNLEVDAQTQAVVDTVERYLAERLPSGAP